MGGGEGGTAVDMEGGGGEMGKGETGDWGDVGDCSGDKGYAAYKKIYIKLINTLLYMYM